MRKFKLVKKESNDLLIKDYPELSYGLVFTLTTQVDQHGYEVLSFSDDEKLHVPPDFLRYNMIELPFGWGVEVPDTVEELL